MCGAINPTKEIIPPPQTAQALARLPARRTRIFVEKGSNPRERAVFSPLPSRFRFFAHRISIAVATKAGITSILSSVQPFELKLPIVQVIKALKSFLLKIRRTDVTDERNVPVAVPAKRSVTLERCFTITEKNNTRIPAAMLPAKANTETGLKYANVKAVGTGRKPDITAPRLAPEEIPMIPASASGFLKNP